MFAEQKHTAMKTNYDSQRQEIERQAAESGVAISFSGYSDAHGLSIYFTDANGVKYRFSSHSVSSFYRMANEKHFPLPFVKTLGKGGVITEKHNQLF